MLKLFRREKPKAPVIQRSTKKPAQRWANASDHSSMEARVAALSQETDWAVRITLERMGGDWPTFKAGQHLICEVMIDGQKLRRPYSICSAENAEQLEICCKQVADGVVSEYLNQTIKPGDVMKVRGPAGHFCLPGDARPLLFVAAGSGITPVFSLIKTALQRDPNQRIQLIYANRTQSSILFRAELQTLADRHPAFEIVHLLSQADETWPGRTGRLSAERLEELAALEEGMAVYLCGPQALMSALETQLANLDLELQVHSEAFTPAARSTIQRPDTSHKLSFDVSGREVEQKPGQSILEAALGAQIPLDYSCTVGGCAACKTKLISGQVVMDEPNCLSQAERDAGYVLACSAYATSSVVIEA